MRSSKSFRLSCSDRKGPATKLNFANHVKAEDHIFDVDETELASCCWSFTLPPHTYEPGNRQLPAIEAFVMFQCGSAELPMQNIVRVTRLARIIRLQSPEQCID
jgi:hypothetical protein